MHQHGGSGSRGVPASSASRYSYKWWMRFCRLRIVMTALAINLLQSSGGMAENISEPGEPRLSREHWLADVEAARQRIERMRREGKSFVPAGASADEEVEDMSRRALEDESLRAGDVISTSRGLFRYKGSSGNRRRPDDFVPVDEPASPSRR
jgi:hypothetical protein